MHIHPSEGEGPRAPVPSPARRRRGSRTLKPIDAAVRRLDDLYNEGSFEQGQRAYKVLRCCLTAADLREPGAVYPTPSATLEKLTGYSPRTISAAYTDLVRAGLIERHVVMEGRRDPVWTTVLTPKCLGLFFGDHSQIPAPPLEKGLKSYQSQGAAPAVQEEAPKTEQPEQPQPEEAQVAEQLLDEEPPQPIHVREDLKPLLAVIAPKELVTVLADCKRFSVWLQDVLAQKLDAIKAARKPFGYLRSLIRCGKDWKPATGSEALAVAKAEQAPDGGQEPAEGDAQPSPAQAFVVDNAGRWLAKPDRGVLINVTGAGCVEYRSMGRTWRWSTLACDAVAKVMAAVEAGRLQFIEAAEAKALVPAAI